MNFLQRFLVRWHALVLVLRGTNPTNTPLPEDRMDPRIPVDTLVAEARGRASADARSGMLSRWLFGDPDDPLSVDFDPPYVNELWARCDAAERTIRARQEITLRRTGYLRRWRDEAASFMRSARAAMTGLAAREARLLDLEQQPAAQTGPRFNPADVPAVDADDQVWEGESSPLSGAWRLLLVLGLVVAELPVHYVSYSGLVDGSTALLVLLSLSTSLLIVLGPYVAGLLVRARRATGAERRIGLVALAIAAPWLFVAVVLGLLRGSIMTADRSLADRHLTEPTVIAMFVGLLLVIGAMSFMLGLARRHPFQEAHARHRMRAEQLDAERQRMVDRLNPSFLDQDADDGVADDPVAAEIGAVRAAYASAEEAYFAALTMAMGDPAFTEAVQHRRGLRRGARYQDPAGAPVPENIPS